MTADLLALLDRDPAAGILAGADVVEAEASCVSVGAGLFTGLTPEDGARLVEWMLAAVRRWRGVVQRHKPSRAIGDARYCEWCSYTAMPKSAGYNWRAWPCPDLTEIADEVRAYLGGAS